MVGCGVLGRNLKAYLMMSLPYWERHYRITSSFFGRVCRRLSSTSPDSLVNYILNQCMYRSTPLSCAWGKDNENRALSAYKQERQERGHSSLEITMSGLVINPEYSWLRASSDGVVHGPGCTDPNGLLEIKCPCDCRISTPFKAASQKEFCCRLGKGKLVLREQHHYYYYQVQGQMAVCSRKRCDFAFANAGISIQRIFFEEIFWTSMASKLKCFYSTAIVPKLANIL